MSWLAWFAFGLLAWNVIPILLLWALPVPLSVKAKGTLSFLLAGVKGALLVLPVLVAPLVVPIALLFTPRSADRLPALFRWWDNDVSINGDREIYWRDDFDGTTYYADAHPRSFWARFVWLGWRNRASWLSKALGHKWKDPQNRRHWGDPLTGRDHEGWTVNEGDGWVYQLYICERLTDGLVFRLNFGHKVWAGYDQRARANVVNITASVLRWTGL